MRCVLDTNLFVAVLTQEPDHAAEARALLNSDHTLLTSVLNLMELRSVLSKQQQFDRAQLRAAHQRIVNHTTVVVPDAHDVLAASRRQRETLLYPMDALILATAEENDATLVSFDAELIEHGAIELSAVS